MFKWLKSFFVKKERPAKESFCRRKNKTYIDHGDDGLENNSNDTASIIYTAVLVNQMMDNIKEDPNEKTTHVEAEELDFYHNSHIHHEHNHCDHSHHDSGSSIDSGSSDSGCSGSTD